MATIKISAATVAEVMAGAKPNRTTFYFDEDLAGFGLYRTTAGTGTYFAEFRPIAGGSKKRIKLGRVGTLKPAEAREAARKAIAHAGLGRDLAKDRSEQRASATVSSMVADYIAEKEMKPSTKSFYEITLRKHIEPQLGTTKAAAVSRVDVQKSHGAISKAGKYSANRAVALLSAAYVWGAKRGYVPEGFNPAKGVDLNREEGRERFLSPDEMKRLGEALMEAETIGFEAEVTTAKHAPKGQRTKMHPSVTGAVRLLMLTGCRLREILNLKWSEVDEARGVLFLSD